MGSRRALAPTLLCSSPLGLVEVVVRALWSPNIAAGAAWGVQCRVPFLHLGSVGHRVDTLMDTSFSRLDSLRYWPGVLRQNVAVRDCTQLVEPGLLGELDAHIRVVDSAGVPVATTATGDASGRSVEVGVDGAGVLVSLATRP
jgi:hypothetical protein